VRAQGLPGLADGGKVGEVYRDIHELAEHHIGVASSQLDADALLMAKDKVCRIHFRQHHVIQSVTMLRQARIVYYSCILYIIKILLAQNYVF